MMAAYTDSVEKLIECLSRFPGVGRRSSERIIEYILSASKEEVLSLTEAITRTKENVRFCRVCHSLSEEDLCKICQDGRRLKEVLCIVERPQDVSAIEKAGTFRGVYHVLLGSISPLEGKGPGDLKIESLLERVKQNHIKEIILATDADTEGETTALYLTKLIKPFGVKLSRIGVGIPLGSNLEYADPATLGRSLESRREV